MNNRVRKAFTSNWVTTSSPAEDVKKHILTADEECSSVLENKKGRFETIIDSQRYASISNSLTNVLSSIEALNSSNKALTGT